MEVDYKDGSGLQGWKWITRMEEDYKDGSGLQGWKWITRMEVDYSFVMKFDLLTGGQEIKLAILVKF